MRTKRLDPTVSGAEGEYLRTELKKKIIGQNQAIDAIVEVYQVYQSGLSVPDKPVGNFLFLGPTGTGKTRIVEAMAEILVGDIKGMIKINCAEFQHSHEIAKIIGSPPGYLGHRETHPLLSQEAINQYHTEKIKMSFICFDEVEKANDALWNLLLGVLDKATLTLGDNRRVDFSKTMIFLTSNLGSEEMSKLARPGLGFNDSKPKSAKELYNKFSNTGTTAAKKKFKPEFLNRLDKIVIFNYLSEYEIREIVDLELKKLQERIVTQNTKSIFTLIIHPEVKDKLVQLGTSLEFGARELRRVIHQNIVHPLSNLISSNQILTGDIVNVFIENNIVTFDKWNNLDLSPKGVVA